jgi:hypothetical protein
MYLSIDIHDPVVENDYIKNYLTSTDFDGVDVKLRLAWLVHEIPFGLLLISVDYCFYLGGSTNYTPSHPPITNEKSLEFDDTF